MWALFVLTALLLLLLSSCGRRRSTSAQLDRREVARLERTAATDLDCPAQEVELASLAPTAAEARGCERIREYSLTCERRRCEWRPMTPAAMLAVADLSCPLTSMDVEAPSAEARVLRGCGREARYTLSCAEAEGCRWILVGPVAPTVPVAPATYGDRAAGPFVPTSTPGSATPAVPPPPGSSPDEAVIPPPPS